MKKNMGTLDRVIRTVIAIAIGVLYFTGVVGGTLGVVLLVVAVAFLLTSAFRFCPSYLPFGLSTCAPESAAASSPPPSEPPATPPM